ncbi:MAG: NHL repeat-containing protein [Elusimicrobiota bacterium]
MNDENQFSEKLNLLLKEYDSKISKIDLHIPALEKEAPARIFFAIDALDEKESPRENMPIPDVREEIDFPATAEPPTKAAPMIRDAKEDDPVRNARGAKWIVLLLGMTAVLLFGIWAISRLTAGAPAVFDLPSEPLTGIAVKNGGLFSMDTSAGKIFSLKIGRSKILLESWGKITAANAQDIAWGETYFWITDPAGEIISRYGGEPQNPQSENYKQLGRHPGAIVVNDDGLWTADVSALRVDHYLISQALTGASIALVGSYRLPGKIIPVGIYESKGVLWVLDAAGRRIVRYAVGQGLLSPQDFTDLRFLVGAGVDLTGMAVSDSGVWVLSSPSRKLYFFPRSGLKWKNLISAPEGGAVSR